MRWISRGSSLGIGIGTKLTVGVGILVGLTLLVVALAILAGRNASRDIEVSEGLRAPASRAAAQAQEALLSMQLHLRGFLVLSGREDIGHYHAARAAFESALTSLEGLANGWEATERSRVQALTDRYARWKRLPPQLFELHEDTLRNRPALRLSSIDVQAQRVKVLAETEAMIRLQKSRPADAVNREVLAEMLTFQSSFDVLATNVMAFGASGEGNFRLTYSSQLVTNAALWDGLYARRPLLTPAQRDHLDRIASLPVHVEVLDPQTRLVRRYLRTPVVLAYLQVQLEFVGRPVSREQAAASEEKVLDILCLFDGSRRDEIAPVPDTPEHEARLDLQLWFVSPAGRNPGVSRARRHH